MPVNAYKYNTEIEEYYGIAENIKQLTNSAGVNPGDIAVISRKHKTLENLVKVLDQESIPYYYENSNNIFENFYIQQIITIAQFCNDLSNQRQGEADHLLPEILAYPFWQISSLTLFRLALAAKNKKQTWLETIIATDANYDEQNEVKKVRDIGDFLIFVANEAKSQTAEQIIDLIVGSGKLDYIVDENDDSEDISTEIVENKPVSPFKHYYFDEVLAQSIHGDAVEICKNNYLTLLSGLRVLVQSVRGHRNKDNFKLADLIKFVNLIEVNGLRITDKQVFNNKTESINLLTAHKAKGLEFEHVFVISANKKEWEPKGRSNTISFPTNVPLEPDKDNADDQIRLFFVAVTRAKTFLNLTSYEFQEDGKPVEEVSFTDIEWQKVEFHEKDQNSIIELFTFPTRTDLVLTDSHKLILRDVVEDYKLSVTNLINFLNVANGGPQNFLETNLLRFPQAKTKHASYGSAVHNAIRALYIEFVRLGKLPSVEYLLNQFEIYLTNEGLNSADYNDRFEVGKHKLQLYYQQRYEFFDSKSIIERDFRHYNVRIGEAEITGKLDKMDILEKDSEIVVTDFKTGKSLINWKPASESDKMKVWKYQTQLVFYKILVENSSIYGNRYKVNKGVLEFVSDPVRDNVVLLDKIITSEEADKMKKLVTAVFAKICKLEFPDTSHYSADMKGINSFIDDLLEGKV